ncbi:MAG: NADH dehydrogenase (quinone) subunit D [bacterium]
MTGTRTSAEGRPTASPIGEAPSAERPDIRTELMHLNFGPQHPATHGTFRLEMVLDGQTIVKVVPHIGFLHSGFEKQGEHMNYNQYVAVTDRMNYMSPFANNVPFHMAVEKLLGIEVPERAQYIRTILLEVARMGDHSFYLGTPAMDLGAVTIFLWSFVGKEECYDIFEMVSGGRYHPSYTRVGGLACDVPKDFEEQLVYLCDRTNPELDEMALVLTKNPIWKRRTQGVGVITKEDVISYGITGPNARASGVARDLRKDEPYLVYDRVDFDIPVGAKGDCYDRYLVRVEEMRQSVRIIRQCLKQMPKDGPINVDPEIKVVLPPKDRVYTRMEELIHHFEIVMPGDVGLCPPKGEVYVCNETANGELGFYVVSDGGKCPYRVRVRPPSFINYAIFPKLVEGHLVSDAVAVLASLNIIAAELDR